MLVLFFSSIPIVIGLFIASMFRTLPTRGGTVFRAAIFLPQVISAVVIGVIWTWIYAATARSTSSSAPSASAALAQPWLGDFTWALPAVGMVGAWARIGLCMVLFVAGIQQIRRSLYDAARSTAPAASASSSRSRCRRCATSSASR